MTITLIQAQKMASAGFERAAALDLKPLAFAVVDSGGHVILAQRQDGCGYLRPQIAIAKAAGALALGVSSRTIGEIASDRPAFVAALSTLSHAGVAPAAGGVIIIDASGAMIGAAGASGDTSDQDEDCVLSGIAAANMRALK
jgi:uncharacterized protein GlcG (DUF336 family)